MREILFRGKRVDNGEWVQGYYTKGFLNPGWEQLKDMIYIFSGEPKHYDFDYAVVIPETVGQYTGLTDKNGTKIFEGDICPCNRNICPSVDKELFEIRFDVQEGQWYGYGWCSTIEANQFEMCEVIGNIHDNPELLTEATP